MKYIAPNHGTPAQTNSILQLRKVLRRILGNKSVKKVNERLLVFCMTIWDKYETKIVLYGNLPKSKKHLIDLLRHSLMIIVYNKQLHNNAILWHHLDIPNHLFAYLGFLSGTFTIYREAGKEGGYLFNHFHQFHRHLDISREINYGKGLTSAHR